MVKEFKAALYKARGELADIEAHEKRLAQRKVQLLHSIAGLSGLCGEGSAIKGMTLADAIRMVFRNVFTLNPSQKFLPREIRDYLRAYGYDLSQFKNEMASIHTAIRRMEASGELERVAGKGYRWIPPIGPVVISPEPAIAWASAGDPTVVISGEPRKKK